MSGGYFLVHRKVFGHHVFAPAICTEVEAWLRLCAAASYEPHKLRYRAEIITVSRGQVPTSYRRLAAEWSWSVNRVTRYLSMLESEGMISKKTDTGFIVITICTYNKYQLPLINTDTVTDTVANTPTDTVTDTVTDTNINKRNKLNKLNKERVLGLASQAKADPKPKAEVLRSGRGSRLAANWELPTAWGNWALEQGMTTAAILKEEEKFRDYWISATGTKASKADWHATWRNWIRKHLEEYAA